MRLACRQLWPIVVTHRYLLIYSVKGVTNMEFGHQRIGNECQ